jgi:hypothetical protein
MLKRRYNEASLKDLAATRAVYWKLRDRTIYGLPYQRDDKWFIDTIPRDLALTVELPERLDPDTYGEYGL